MLVGSFIVAGVATLLALWIGVGQEVDMSRSRGAFAHGAMALLSWPARFLNYRSGHGSHTLRT